MCRDVAPFGPQVVEEEGPCCFEVIGDLAADFVAAAEDVDRAAKAAGGRGFAQQADDGLDGLTPHSLARARDVGKAVAFERVEL